MIRCAPKTGAWELLSACPFRQGSELAMEFQECVHHKVVNEHETVVGGLGGSQSSVNLFLKLPEFGVAGEKEVPLFKGFRVRLGPYGDKI